MRFALALVLATGCADKSGDADTDGSGELASGCDANEDCPRGSECDPGTHECMPLPPPPDATEDPAPAEFENKVVPFFRGRVCTVHEVRTGAGFPVYLNPCLHPCLDLVEYQFKHSWGCVGESCDGYGLMWVVANGMACPEDAFGQFDASMCNYDAFAEFTVQVVDPGTELRFEIPFVSNEDMAMIAADSGNAELIRQLIDQYAPDDARVPGMMNISLLPEHPAPPTTCGDMGEGCNCFEIGF